MVTNNILWLTFIISLAYTSILEQSRGLLEDNDDIITEFDQAEEIDPSEDQDLNVKDDSLVDEVLKAEESVPDEHEVVEPLPEEPIEDIPEIEEPVLEAPEIIEPEVVVEQDPATYASVLYPNIELEHEYLDNLPGFEPEDAGNMPDWYYDFYPETVKLLDDQQIQRVWKYFSIDVASQLGDELRVTDPEHALNSMDKDLKFENVEQYKDLVIEVYDQLELGFSDPNIFINLNDSAPNVAEFDLRCSFYGEDVCVISGKELAAANATKITVGVYCREKCDFGLEANLQTEIFFESGKMHNLYFKEKQQRIVRFSIPDSEDINTIEVKGISQNKFSKFEMLILQGNEIPDTSLALVLEPAWENGYVGKFYKNCFCFCVGCNYTMLISSESAGYISVGASISNETIDLRSYPNGESYDFVGYWDTKCYKYNVRDGSQDFRVNFQSFSGEPNVYVNPLVPIDSSNFTSAKYNSREYFWNEELVLDPDQREKDSALIGMFYMCIYGSTSSSYKISAKNENHDKLLKTGLAEGGFVDQNEIKQYYFTDSILMDENIKIKFDTHVMIGSVRVKSKLCVRPQQMSLLEKQCNYTLEELLEEDPDEKILMHIDDEIESPDHNICSRNSATDDDEYSFRQDGNAPCIYVIGVIGLTDYTSQYSIMIQLEDESGQNHPIMLSEGVPSVAMLKPQDYKYYMLSVDDESIQKLTIQLSTIHGDPDMFVSSTSKVPSWDDFEQRSINAGLYPDLIIFEKTEDKPLAKNYYISVESWEQSSYSIVFFTESKNGNIGVQKLIAGRKQKGVFHINNNFTNLELPILEQPHLIYHFQLTNKMLKNDKEVEIRLNSEHGEFIYLVEVGKIPVVDWEFDSDKSDEWIGGEISNVIIYEEDLDQELQGEVDRKTDEEHIFDFYIKVLPLVRESDFKAGPITEPYVFNIAFYNEEQMVHLQEGRPQRGVVTNQTFDYFYYDIQDLDTDYEISLGPISGGVPDLVISLDPENKYPTISDNDLNSFNSFTTDSVILTQKMITDYLTIRPYIDDQGPLQVYVGIYTPDPLAIYSIVMTRMVEFNPIQLNIGQIMTGSLNPGFSKYYYVTASTDSKKPLKIDLMPNHGNVNLYVTLIGDFSLARSVWQNLANEPNFVSESSMGIDTIILDPQTVPEYAEKCPQSCIVLIKVEACDEEDTSASFKIQVSQDFEELVDSVRVSGSIAGSQSDDGELSRYRFYKFFKACDVECDLEIFVFPQTSGGEVISVLINYEDLTDASLDVARLPTWNNEPAWSASLKVGSVITIEGNEPWFYEHHGKQIDDEQDEDRAISRGYYIIGVQAYNDVSYVIEATTTYKDHFFVNETDKPIDAKQLFLGTQDREYLLQTSETKYFYWQNWREEDFKVSIDFLKEHFTSSRMVEIMIGKMKDTDGEQGRLPKYSSQLPENWLQATSGKNFIEVKEDSDFFCVLCTYVIKIKSKFDPDTDGQTSKTGESKIRIIIEQQISLHGDDDEMIKIFKGSLTQNMPQPVRLEKDQIIFLTFAYQHLADLDVEVDILLGTAVVKLLRNSDEKVLFEYPCPEDPTHHIKNNLIKFDLSSDNMGTINTASEYASSYKQESYSLKIESHSEIFQGIAYLRNHQTLDIIADGQPQEIDFTFENPSGLGTKKQTQTYYFLYLPTSHKFDLQINANLKSFASDRGSLKSNVKSDDQNLDSRRVYDPEFMNFKVAFKRIELDSDVKTDDVKWAEEFTHDEQFDTVLTTEDRLNVNSIYDTISFEVDPEGDLILVKLEGIFDPLHSQRVKFAEVEYSFQISASDVVYLAPDKAVRGVVSDNPNKFRVYEFYINKMQFPEVDPQVLAQKGMDLFISLTPCSGQLKFYISDNYKNLFKKQSEVTTSDHHAQGKLDVEGDKKVVVEHKTSKVGGGWQQKNITLQMDEYFNQFRVQGKRLRNIDQIEGTKLYIGIKSLSEGFDPPGDKRLLKKDKKERPNVPEHSLNVNGQDAHEVRQHKFNPFKSGKENRGGGGSLGEFTHHKDEQLEFKPQEETIMKSSDQISSFEIQASFILGGEPDILDLYKVKDQNFGIQMTNMGRQKENKGDHKQQETLMEWSPVMRLAISDSHESSSKQIYKEVDQGIEYRVYLGYNSQAMDIFASPCQLEEFDKYGNIQQGNRQLEMTAKKTEWYGHGKNGNDQEEMNKYRVYTTKDSSSMTISGIRDLKDLKAAVVIAYIYEEGKETASLVYAPVSFDNTFDHKEFQVLRRFKIWLGVAAVMGILCCISICFYKKFDKKQGKDQQSRDQYQMREMNQDSQHSVSVTDSSMTARSGASSDMTSANFPRNRNNGSRGQNKSSDEDD